MLFTIAIPTYNNVSTIKNAIDSALNQDYNQDYEVLVVNNASTDSTLEEISAYTGSKIRIVSNERTVDLFQNHTICFNEAKGDYILFCHSDDVLFPFALRLLSERISLRGFPKRYIVWGRSMFRDYYASMRLAGYSLNDVVSGQYSLYCFTLGLTHSGTCYSRKSILEIGAFPAMKSKITPLDWYIMNWAAFNCFEFEMMDRLLFKREYASTAKEIGHKDWLIANKDALDILLEHLAEQQKRELFTVFLKLYRWDSYPYWKMYVSLKRRIIYVMRQIFREPYRIHHIIRTIFIKI